MDKGIYRKDGLGECANSKETGCCVAFRTERVPNVGRFEALVLKDEDVGGEFGEEYGEVTDGE